jgi:hypothetical protein
MSSGNALKATAPNQLTLLGKSLQIIFLLKKLKNVEKTLEKPADTPKHLSVRLFGIQMVNLWSQKIPEKKGTSLSCGQIKTYASRAFLKRPQDMTKFVARDNYNNFVNKAKKS